MYRFLTTIVITAAIATTAANAARPIANLLDSQRARLAVSQNPRHPGASVFYSGRKIDFYGAINNAPAFRTDQAGRRLPLKSLACRPKATQPVVYAQQICEGPDGSTWALQRYKRHLYLSHWRGQPAEFQQLRWDNYVGLPRLCGRLVYKAYGVNNAEVELEGLRTDLGKGWMTIAALKTLEPDGSFCYSFGRQLRGYGLGGSVYRVTAVGPGVTPIVQGATSPQISNP